MKIGIIGCGNMGGGMARHLMGQGHAVVCFDPSLATLDALSRDGATAAKDPAALAQKSDHIILSLPTAAIVRAVMAELLAHVSPGTIILDTSTSEPETSQEMARLAASRHAYFIDGPVSGGPAAANAGTMTMLLGGDPDAIARLGPLTEILTAKTVTVGGPGAGHAAKIANNMLCAANLVLVAEAVKMGKAAGVDPADLLEGINAGSGRSGVSEVNFPKWVLNDAFDSGFTMGLMRKDVGLALTLAAQQGLALNGFAGVAEIWRNAASDIPDEADFNEIVRDVL